MQLSDAVIFILEHYSPQQAQCRFIELKLNWKRKRKFDDAFNCKYRCNTLMTDKQMMMDNGERRQSIELVVQWTGIQIILVLMNFSSWHCPERQFRKQKFYRQHKAQNIYNGLYSCAQWDCRSDRILPLHPFVYENNYIVI